MKDKNGKELSVGDKVVFVDSSRDYREDLGRVLTVRKFSGKRARCDDGTDPDFNKMTWTMSIWATPSQIVKA